jgi:hypothetical protein
MHVDHWWNHPDRACTDDYRFSELLLANRSGTKKEHERMANACRVCTVYLDCLDGVIASGRAWDFQEIQAGLTRPPVDLPPETPDHD